MFFDYIPLMPRERKCLCMWIRFFRSSKQTTGANANRSQLRRYFVLLTGSRRPFLYYMTGFMRLYFVCYLPVSGELYKVYSSPYAYSDESFWSKSTPPCFVSGPFELENRPFIALCIGLAFQALPLFLQSLIGAPPPPRGHLKTGLCVPTGRKIGWIT